MWGEQLWVYDGRDKKGHMLGDLYRFEFMTRSWTKVEQLGCIPDRRLWQASTYSGYHKVRLKREDKQAK
jgi:hypothetical protein